MNGSFRVICQGYQMAGMSALLPARSDAECLLLRYSLWPVYALLGSIPALPLAGTERVNLTPRLAGGAVRRAPSCARRICMAGRAAGRVREKPWQPEPRAAVRREVLGPAAQGGVKAGWGKRRGGRRVPV